VITYPLHSLIQPIDSVCLWDCVCEQTCLPQHLLFSRHILCWPNNQWKQKVALLCECGCASFISSHFFTSLQSISMYFKIFIYFQQFFPLKGLSVLFSPELPVSVITFSSAFSHYPFSLSLLSFLSSSIFPEVIFSFFFLYPILPPPSPKICLWFLLT